MSGKSGFPSCSRIAFKLTCRRMANFRSFRRFWSLTAIVVMLQLVVVQAMAASADLHHHCHDHSHEPEHQCAVTLILQSGYDRVVPDIVPVDLIPEPPPATVELPDAIEARSSHLVGGVLAHAPPRGP